MIALVLMVIDHIGYYFEGTPSWLRWLGRGSYPLFLFCMVWGYQYTRNRFVSQNGYGNHNIFLSMFLVGVLISTVELYQKDRKKGAVLLGAIAFVQLLYFLMPNIIPFTRNLSGDLLTGIVPNLALNEYGFSFVVLGVLMYFLKEKKDLFCVMYILFCISQFSIEMFESGGIGATQWLMVLVLPLMLGYNNQKGQGMKYFFYIFYPAHTFLLFYLAEFVFQ